MTKIGKLLENLKLFKNVNPYPLDSVWPPGRRSAVLVLLFIGSRGELRVLLTNRSRKLRSFAGQVSLPGGKADSDKETFEMVARREAMEEIGLPIDSDTLGEQFNMKIEQISSELPCYMSRTLLSVKPVVFFLYNRDNDTNKYKSPLNVINFFGKLNPGETSSLFSIPINDLVYQNLSSSSTNGKENLIEPEYFKRKSALMEWGGLKWTVKHFHYPRDNHNDVTWLNNMEDLSLSSSSDVDIDIDIGSNKIIQSNLLRAIKYRDVWGLTAKILTDVACVANNIVSSEDRSFGHEDLIYGLHDLAEQFQPKGRSSWERKLINDDPEIKYSDVLPTQFISQLENKELSF